MVATNQVSATFARQNSFLSTAESSTSVHTAETPGSGPVPIEHPSLRSSRSRILAAIPDRQPMSSQPSSGNGHAGNSLRFVDEVPRDSPHSSEEDLYTSHDQHSYSRFGRQIGHTPTAHSPAHDRSNQGSTVATMEYHYFHPDRFRSLYDQVDAKTEAGMQLAQNDRSEDDSNSYPPSPTSSEPSPMENEDDYVQFARIGNPKPFRRMPTIESLGSREVMSLASSTRGEFERSIHNLSRPPTRTNTLTMSEGGSCPPSRSNSLNAKIALSSPVESNFAVKEGVSELGELAGTSSLPSTRSERRGSKGTASYYTAGSNGSPLENPSDSNWPPTGVRSSSR